VPSSDQLETMLARLLRDQAEAQNDISSAQKRKSEVRDNRILSLKAALAKSKPKPKPEPNVGLNKVS
jgi:hypothetical protein